MTTKSTKTVDFLNPRETRGVPTNTAWFILGRQSGKNLLVLSCIKQVLDLDDKSKKAPK